MLGVQCTKSKGQCNRAAPACRRCKENGIRCAYPYVDLPAVPDMSSATSNHISVVPRGVSEGLANDIGGISIVLSIKENDLVDHELLLLTSPHIHLYIGQLLAALLLSMQLPLSTLMDYDTYWFLSPGTWNIAYLSLWMGLPACCYNNESVAFVVKQ